MVRTKTWGCQRSTKLTLNWTSFNAQCICFSFLFSSRIGRQRDTFKSPIHFCFNLCTYFIELLNYQIMSEKITMDSGVVYKTLLVWTIIIFRNSICWLFCWLHLYLDWNCFSFAFQQKLYIVVGVARGGSSTPALLICTIYIFPLISTYTLYAYQYNIFSSRFVYFILIKCDNCNWSNVI